LKTTIQSFQEILNKIDETKAQFYGNNNINNIISTISQNVNDVKKHLSKDLTIENELIQIQKSLEDIKNSTYEIRSEQITKYINTINNYVEQQTKHIQNNPNKDEIDDIIQKIVNYNKESEIKLPTIIDNKNNVTSIISHINKVINLIKSEYNNNNNVSYNVAKKHEEDANNIIRDLDTSQNMVNNLIQKNLKIINDLKNRKQEMENRNNLHAINRQQEITQAEHINNTYHHDINDTNNINKNHQYSSSDRKNSSKTKDTGNSVKYAGAITLGLVAYYVIIRTKEKKDKDEMEFDKSTSFYDENENKNEKYNNNNNVSYNVAKKHEEDANNIIRDLDTSQNMVNNLIQKNLKIINDLKNRKQEMENRNNLHAINRQQEITQAEHINNTYHHDINDTNNINKNHQYSSSDRKNSSKTKDTEN
ncbi:hypothetical protein, conserved, partial [Plasmodium berghei]